MYTDTHFHCNEMIKKKYSLNDIRSLFGTQSVSLAIDIGIRGAEEFAERKKNIGDIPEVYLCCGYHPSQTRYIDPQDIEAALAPVLSDEKVIGVGEMGMDFHWDFGSAIEQKNVFMAQIETANRHSLPIIVHNRKASKDVLAVLQDCRPEYGGIMHCFDSDLDTAISALDLGMYISFAGNLTFKRNQYLRELIRAIPIDKLLLETDSPYLTPEPKRGQPNNPANIEHIYACAAAARNISVDKIVHAVRANTQQLFPRIKPLE